MPTDGQSPAVTDRPVTRGAAEQLGASRLAEQWADRLTWPWPGNRTACDELAELAHMSALAAWLRRWQPIYIHSALLGDARLEDVAAAFGNSLEETFQCWHEWVAAQRKLVLAGMQGVTGEEYRAVVRRFAETGVRTSSF